MTAKLITIIAIAVAAVVGMFVFGKFMDGGSAEESSLKKD